MNLADRDLEMQLLSDSLDVAKEELRAMTVGTLDWRMKREQVQRMDERLHQLRIERMTGT